MKLTENFNLRELTKSQVAERNGIQTIHLVTTLMH